MIDHTFWYASRAAGISAYLLLSLSTIWGLTLSTRLGERLTGKPSLYEAHRVTSLLALAFTAIHMVVLLGDDYLSWGIGQLLLPLAAPYRPLATATGILAMYCTVVVVASFYVRSRIGYRTWRRIHYAAFFSYAAATLHGITAGTDTREPWMLALYAGSLVAVAFLVNLRLLGGAGPKRPIIKNLSSIPQERRMPGRDAKVTTSQGGLR